MQESLHEYFIAQKTGFKLANQVLRPASRETFSGEARAIIIWHQNILHMKLKPFCALEWIRHHWATMKPLRGPLFYKVSRILGA